MGYEDNSQNMTAETEKPKPEYGGLNQLQIFIQGEYIKETRAGVDALLDTFHELLKLETNNFAKTEDAVESLQGRLKEIENECWSRVRSEYISKLNVEDGEEQPSSLAEMVVTLTEKLDKIKDGLEMKIQSILYQEEEYKTEIRNLKQQLAEERHNIVEMKWKRQKDMEDASVDQLSKEILVQQLEEKRDLIAELQRSSTVQLWEKEKEKVLAKAKEREEQMKLEYAELKQTYDELRDRTTKRIKDLEDKVNMGKMKTLGKLTPRTEWEADNENLKRQIYMKHMDLTKIEQEIVKQQKLYAGCVKGIRRDFKIITERQESGKIAAEDIRKLRAILESIFKGACDGRLEQTKADLPLHYFAVDEDITGHPIKKLSKLRLQPVPVKLDVIEETLPEGQEARRQSRVWSYNSSSAERPVVTQRQTLSRISDDDSATNHNSNSLKMNGSSGVKDSYHNGEISPEGTSSSDAHPDLTDEDGILDMELTKKHFPFLTEQEIKDHYEQFQNYDSNDDRTLDFVEMLQAIRGTVGDYFKPRQIKEAIAEIDVDRSDSVDFYEYLRIAALLLKKAGKSEIFRSGLVKDAGNSMSRVCSIQ
ncbi:uncharacterized protein [Amphiura filiformis]|uniref:uncharacterized protein n=1 Tax=Amphiura filiformis TaxID=82378 RepID=UPI003B21715D